MMDSEFWRPQNPFSPVHQPSSRPPTHPIPLLSQIWTRLIPLFFSPRTLSKSSSTTRKGVQSVFFPLFFPTVQCFGAPHWSGPLTLWISFRVDFVFLSSPFHSFRGDDNDVSFLYRGTPASSSFLFRWSRKSSTVEQTWHKQLGMWKSSNFRQKVKKSEFWICGDFCFNNVILVERICNLMEALKVRSESHGEESLSQVANQPIPILNHMVLIRSHWNTLPVQITVTMLTRFWPTVT